MSISTATNDPNNIDLELQRGDTTYQHGPQQTVYNTPLSLEQFRVLVGIPQNAEQPRKREDQKTGSTTTNGPVDTPSHGQRQNQFHTAPNIRSATITTSASTRRSFLVLFRLLSRPKFVRRWIRPEAMTATSEEEEYATSLYYSLVREESDQWRLYHIYNVVTYAALILQLVIASALIIIGAIPSSTPNSGGSDTYRGNRISVAVLGAVTGLLTGVMSLLKGQGLPLRFLQYASRLRQVRDKVEFMERTLRANIQGVIVTHQDVLDIWHDFETVINERDMNRPDAWASASMPTNLRDSTIDRTRRGQPPANAVRSVNTAGIRQYAPEQKDDVTVQQASRNL